MDYIEQAKKLIECLKEKNYFEPDAKRKLEEVTPETLSNYAITIEKNFNFDTSAFEYRPEEGIWVRTYFSGNLQFETEENYKKQYKKCCSCENPCYKERYKIEEFIELIVKGVFEPMYFDSI